MDAKMLALMLLLPAGLGAISVSDDSVSLSPFEWSKPVYVTIIPSGYSIPKITSVSFQVANESEGGITRIRICGKELSPTFGKADFSRHDAMGCLVGGKIPVYMKGWGNGKYSIALYEGDTVRDELDPWWNSSWQKRKKITVTENSGNSLTNYPVKLTIAYDSGMQADFDDLRFTNANGSLLDYWVQEYTASSSAVVWVEADYLSASSNTTLYAYYGNSTVSSASSIDRTFVFGDDFSGTSLNTTKWPTSSGSVSVSGGVANLTRQGGTDATIKSQALGGLQNHLLEFRLLHHYSGNDNPVGIEDSGSGVGSLYITRNDATSVYYYKDGSGQVDSGLDVTHEQYHTYRYRILSTGTQGLMIDNSGTWTSVTRGGASNPANIDQPYFQARSTNGNYLLIDWAIVRQHVSPEPSYEFGEGENYSTISVTLISPENNTTYGYPANNPYTFKAENGIYTTMSCTIYFNNTPKDHKPNVQNNTQTTFTLANITKGTWNWKISCSDGTNTGESETRTVNIVNLEIDYTSPTPENNSWANTAYTIKIQNTGTDTLNACNLTHAENTYAMTITGQTANYTITSLTDGNKNYNVTCNSSTGIIATTQTRTIKIDTAPPTTNIEYDKTANAKGWHNTNVQITLACNDGTGSGCSQTQYKINTGDWTTYTSPITITSEANNTIKYKSKDALNNQETEKTAYVPIDKTSPTAEITTAQYSTKIDVYCVCADTLSGCDKANISYDSTIYPAPVNKYYTINGTTGAHNIFCLVWDLAENTKTSEIKTIIIDDQPPIINIISQIYDQITVKITDNSDKEVTCTLVSAYGNEPCGTIKTNTQTTIIAQRETNYTLKITDKSGNTATTQFTPTKPPSNKHATLTGNNSSKYNFYDSNNIITLAGFLFTIIIIAGLSLHARGA